MREDTEKRPLVESSQRVTRAIHLSKLVMPARPRSWQQTDLGFTYVHRATYHGFRRLCHREYRPFPRTPNQWKLSRVDRPRLLNTLNPELLLHPSPVGVALTPQTCAGLVARCCCASSTTALDYVVKCPLRFPRRQVSDPGKGVMGAGAHSDYGLLTLLATVS